MWGAFRLAHEAYPPVMAVTPAMLAIEKVADLMEINPGFRGDSGTQIDGFLVRNRKPAPGLGAAIGQGDGADSAQHLWRGGIDPATDGFQGRGGFLEIAQRDAAIDLRYGAAG